MSGKEIVLLRQSQRVNAICRILSNHRNQCIRISHLGNVDQSAIINQAKALNSHGDTDGFAIPHSQQRFLNIAEKAQFSKVSQIIFYLIDFGIGVQSEHGGPGLTGKAGFQISVVFVTSLGPNFNFNPRLSRVSLGHLLKLFCNLSFLLEERDLTCRYGLFRRGVFVSADWCGLAAAVSACCKAGHHYAQAKK